MAINPHSFTTRPEIEGTFGVVTSTHWIGTAVGMSILEGGGNAFDAAVATAFTLQVVEPHLNGPGGDVPILVFDARRDRVEVICGQGPAPERATIEHYRTLGLDLVPGTGLLAACVPGAFDAWMLLLVQFGTLGLRDILMPAIGYADKGYPLPQQASVAIGTVEALFRDHWPTSAALYLPGGKVPEPGALFTNRALAAMYSRLLHEAECASNDREQQIEHARRTWSEGFVSEAVDAFFRTQSVVDCTGERHSGVLTGNDMACWRAGLEAPVSYEYGRYRVYKPGAWSQGPVMLQQLALLKGFDLNGLNPLSTEFIHLQVECAKLAFADREKFYGDPEFVSVPLEVLLSESYNDDRRQLVGGSASLELRPGSIGSFGMEIESCRSGRQESFAGTGTGEPTVASAGLVRGDTVHFDIVDISGNMVSATPSGGWFQSSPAVPELGFCLGTRAQMFWLDEAHPAALLPRKRPRTTLSPTLALRDEDPYLAWGSPGGDQQDQWATQFFLRHVHAGMNLQEAIDAPAWHSEHFPSSFWPRIASPGLLVLEGRIHRRTAEELRARGHRVVVGPEWSEGRLTAASQVGSRRRAAANPRGMQGYAAGR